MPLYEYECEECGGKFEEIRSMKVADSTISCSICHSENTKRVLSTFFSRNTSGVNSSPNRNCSNCRSNSCSSCR